VRSAIVLALVLSGCAPAPAWEQHVYLPDGRSLQKIQDECRYEAMKASPAAVSNLRGLGAAVGASAAREAEIYAACMRLRGG
jgi:hypothetical protein